MKIKLLKGGEVTIAKDGKVSVESDGSVEVSLDQLVVQGKILQQNKSLSEEQQVCRNEDI